MTEPTILSEPRAVQASEPTAIEGMQAATSASRATNALLTLGRQLSYGSDEFVAGSVGAATGVMGSLALAAQAAEAFPMGWTVGPMTVIFGGLATLIARRLKPERQRQLAERARVVIEMARYAGESASPAIREKADQLVIEMLGDVVRDREPVGLPAPQKSPHQI